MSGRASWRSAIRTGGARVREVPILFSERRAGQRARWACARYCRGRAQPALVAGVSAPGCASRPRLPGGRRDEAHGRQAGDLGPRQLVARREELRTADGRVQDHRARARPHAAARARMRGSKLCLARLRSLGSKPLGPATSTGIWAAPGHVLYVTGDSLVAHRFDDRRNSSWAIRAARDLAAWNHGPVARPAELCMPRAPVRRSLERRRALTQRIASGRPGEPVAPLKRTGVKTNRNS